jgi:hypothetical protein
VALFEQFEEVGWMRKELEQASSHLAARPYFTSCKKVFGAPP